MSPGTSPPGARALEIRGFSDLHSGPARAPNPAATIAPDTMLWNPLRLFDDRGRQYRLIHERWLNEAIRAPGRYPRIPTRRADAGGFSALLNRPGGTDRAERWWELALERVDLDG
jgi:hypothetical protein